MGGPPPPGAEDGGAGFTGVSSAGTVSTGMANETIII